MVRPGKLCTVGFHGKARCKTQGLGHALAFSRRNNFGFNRLAAQLRLLAGFAICLLSLSLPVSDAAAQSATCRSLQAQLAQIETGRGAGNPRQYQRYQRAIQDQTAQIRKTERASRKNSCGVRNSNKCQRIRSSLSKMYANLDSLQRTAQTFAPRGGTRAERAMVLRSMQRNGCGDRSVRQARIESDTQRRPTLLEQIFGTKTYSSDGSFYEGESPIRGGGTYRTLCVRTCDGYYFPISFSTSQSRFEEDLAQCQQMCPGTETALFVHPMPGGDAETSISYRTGQPYASLQNAFSYRKAVNPECTCRSTRMANIEEIAGTTDVLEVEPKKQEVALPLPKWREDIALDSETLANSEGGMSVEKLADVASGGGGDPIRSGSIRIVGPAFFPVQ